jgi:transposase
MDKQDTDLVENKIGTIKIAIDMHLRSFRVVRQLDHVPPQPAQRFTPEKFYPWLAKEIAKAGRVVVCYEAGCFGYGPARRMQQLGAEVLVIAPQNWDEQSKRQVNDKLDAQVMCRRLSDYLCGHQKALSVVRIPTPEEEQRRAEGRLRGQLAGEVRRLRSMGRSLLLAQGLAMRGRWWVGRSWVTIQGAMAPWVVKQLAVYRAVILPIEQQVKEIEARLKTATPQKKLFVGEGDLSAELLERELIDLNRFKNGRQVGNYFGLCPSESSSGESRQLGSITKHGSPRLRSLMIQLAWRVVGFQPEYRGMQRWKEILGAKAQKSSASARKKAIVALARRLAVDLWRIRTGRVTAEELGLRLRASA